MSASKMSYFIPAIATIIGAIITSYASFMISEVKSRDLGSIEKGQKLCVVAKTEKWHNITVVPQNWTASMCKNLSNHFGGNAYYIGCSFKDSHVTSDINSSTPPKKNCGW